MRAFENIKSIYIPTIPCISIYIKYITICIYTQDFITLLRSNITLQDFCICLMAQISLNTKIEYFERHQDLLGPSSEQLLVFGVRRKTLRSFSNNFTRSYIENIETALNIRI